MAEWFKAAVLKTAVGASPPWVRIPLSPPNVQFRLIDISSAQGFHRNGSPPTLPTKREALMKAEDSSELVEIVPEMARHFAARLEFSMNQVAEQVVKSSGWLTATLLAVNGGAAIALLQNSELAVRGAHCLWWFGAGLLCAMANAFSIQTLASRILRPLAELHLLWARASIDGEYDTAALAQAEAKVTRISRWRFIPPAIGWFSAACFAVGGSIFVRLI